jgi:hypothetical protein
MVTGTLSDGGFSFSANTVNDVSQKLHEFISQLYGDCYIDNCRTGSTYARCNIISSLGEYIIHPRSREENKITFNIG